MATIGMSAQVAPQGSTAPRLKSLSLLTTVQLTGSVTRIPVVLGETEDGSRLDEISIQLDRAIPLLLQEVGGMGHGTPPLVAATTGTIDAFLPTEYHAFTPGTFFDLTEDGAAFRNLMLGGSAEGTYVITAVTLTDRNGDSSHYSSDDLAALGASTSFTVLPDHTAPTIAALTVPTASPVLGDGQYTAAADGSYAFLHLGVVDLLGPTLVSGVIHLLAPDGSALDVPVPIGPSSGRYGFESGRVEVGKAFVSTAGVYRIAGVDTLDTVGNATHYAPADLAATGFATSFAVLQQGDLADVRSTGVYAMDGTAGQDTLQLSGNVTDYILSRGNLDFYGTTFTTGQLGDFVLTAANGSGVYSVGETIETVRFQNGQYLALQDLPAYIGGSDALSIGGAQDDLLYQSRAAGYEAFRGGGGVDQLYLNGNIYDYTVRSAQAETLPDGHIVFGLELISRNGSGALFIDSTTDTIYFQNGQYLAYQDIGSYVSAAAPDPVDRRYLVLADGFPGGPVSVVGFSNTDNWLLLDGNASDFSFRRDTDGAFVLSGKEQTIAVEQSVDAVQFGNGQYLALHDLPAYISGNAIFLTGTGADDTFFLPLSGDQYISGGEGVDNLYIHGNTQDYVLQAVHVAANVSHPTIDGYELVAKNGSGNIYTDSSTEMVHFQSGRYLSFTDLPAYVHDISGLV